MCYGIGIILDAIYMYSHTLIDKDIAIDNHLDWIDEVWAFSSIMIIKAKCDNNHRGLDALGLNAFLSNESLNEWS